MKTPVLIRRSFYEVFDMRVRSLQLPSFLRNHTISRFPLLFSQSILDASVTI